MAQTVLMRFPEDGSIVPVPTERVAEARAEGAAIYKAGMFGRPTARGLVAGAADMLPGAGSIAGSMAGGLMGATAGSAIPGPGTVVGGVGGRMAGGVAGGTAGKLAQEGIYRALGYGDAPGSVAQEAAFQTGAGATGEVLGGVAGGAGRIFARTGLAPKLADGWRVVEDMLKKRLPIGGPGMVRGNTALNTPVVGPLLAAGGKEAKREWVEAARARKATNVAAGRAGVRIPRDAAVNAVSKILVRASKEMADEPELAYFQKVVDSWRNRKGEWLRPGEVQAVVTRFNNTTKPVFRAMKQGTAIPEDALQQKVAQRSAISEALSKELENNVPGWKEQTAKLAQSIATRDAISAAEKQGPVSLGSRLAVGGAIGGTLEGLSGRDVPGGSREHALIGAALMANPAALSRLALFMTDPTLQALLRNAPRTSNIEGMEK